MDLQSEVNARITTGIDATWLVSHSAEASRSTCLTAVLILTKCFNFTRKTVNKTGHTLQVDIVRKRSVALGASAIC